MDIFEYFLACHKSAKSFGFYFADLSEITSQIELELDEVKHELATNGNQQALQEELGDLLHACLELVNFCQLDPQKTIELAVAKFAKRFTTMQKIVAEEKVPHFADLSRDTQLLYWQKAKQRLKNIDTNT